ncbi:hypothetical protein RB628_09800 [Streptomyces sp. ADMS]|uniref:hypothetical protein n=1 Tax=Streptomyces sp. ADMS TaxID=3071415 RepID=UPI00296F5398|nr:hypothetical protein [Streptomyces sp. ADMS]MDW4905629.1 hypothetical protein [Streptomyces sp. ADMS]
MASREQITSPGAAASEALRPSWLPALSGLSLEELAALDGAEFQASVDRLKSRVNRPLSTVAGSSGS